jgi:hypothetical protein
MKKARKKINVTRGFYGETENEVGQKMNLFSSWNTCNCLIIMVE